MPRQKKRTPIEKATDIVQEISDDEITFKIPNSIFGIECKATERLLVEEENEKQYQNDEGFLADDLEDDKPNPKRINQETLYDVYLVNTSTHSSKLTKRSVPNSVLKRFIKEAIQNNKRSITSKRKTDKASKTIRIILSRIENKSKYTTQSNRSLKTKKKAH